MTPPRYRELPETPGLGMPNAWGIVDQALGTAGLLTEAHVRDAAALVTTGECLTLNLSLSEIDPPLFGRAPYRHSVIAADRNHFEDVIDGWNPQASSQWDGLGHVRAREAGFFGGIGVEEADPDARPSIEALARAGIVGRGVLLDVAAWARTRGADWDPFAGTAVDADDLRAAIAHFGIELRTGDILCLRFGWVEAYRALDRQARADVQLSQRFTGLRGDGAMAEFLWDRHIAALCADNPAVEVAPGNREDGSLHRRLLPLLGMTLGELFDLEGLATRCHAAGRYTFMFVGVPLPLPGGVSSPSNAIAIL